MKVFDTSALTEHMKLSADETSWIYNGLDCCVTLEVFRQIESDLLHSDPTFLATYQTAMAKVAPVLSMQTRGLKQDPATLAESIATYQSELDLLQARWDYLCEELFGHRINWNSPLQMKVLFYDVFRLKAVRKRNSKGEFAPTVNADALLRFTEYYYIAPFSRLILRMRELGKKIGFLKTEGDPDGYMRTSLNIAGTETGRFNSRFSAFGTGTNLQNVEEILRRPFVPDEGRIFINVDLEQADSRGLGAIIWNIFVDSFGPVEAGKYLDACESGDLHTTVCAMCWQDLGWPEPWDLKLAKRIASRPFFKSMSYRDASKRLGHGTNFFGTPRTMAQHTHTLPMIIEDFQRRYFSQFPLIGNYEKDLTKDDWHSWVQYQLKHLGYLDNLFGRRRYFFGRATDPRTLREAIAYGPQSTTGEFLDRGWLKVWEARPDVWLHIPVHDSILMSVEFGPNFAADVEEILSLLRVTIELKQGRAFTVPLEAKVGWNWGNSIQDEKTGLWENPHGLRKWTGKEDRQPPKRVRGRSLKALLDRPVR